MFWHQLTLTWGVADHIPLGITQVREWMPRDAMWHGQDQRANPWKSSDGNLALLSLRPRLSAFLQKWHWPLLKQWSCSNFLCFWVLLTFIFNLLDTTHIPSNSFSLVPRSPACLRTFLGRTVIWPVRVVVVAKFLSFQSYDSSIDFFSGPFRCFMTYLETDSWHTGVWTITEDIPHKD